jgi:hypothetical protein
MLCPVMTFKIITLLQKRLKNFGETGDIGHEKDRRDFQREVAEANGLSNRSIYSSPINFEPS